MQIVTDPQALQTDCLARRRRGERIGFVPTMGFLHRGHTSLLALARPRCDHLVVSIYVNPLQFGEGEDLDRYPRDPEGDAAACEAAGVDCLFMPADLYAPGHATRVRVEGLTSGLCGASRPTHFEGVTTVVARLFGLVQPDIAVFGEKDYQQLAVIRRMARDLAIPVDVVGGPLIRDDDGVALSSRNAYLDADQRRRARSISQTLSWLADAVATGQRDVARLRDQAIHRLSVDALDYLEIVDPDSLEPLQRIDGPARALAAAYLGKTRLIDNLALVPPAEQG